MRSRGTTTLVPLRCVHDGDELLVVASGPGHPAWYHNLLAHPMGQVETGSDEYDAIAVPAEGAQRDQLFERVVREHPQYADDQARTSWLLPVVTLKRSYTRASRDDVVTVADKLVEIHTWLRAQLRHVGAETDAYFVARATHEPPHPVAPGLSLQLRQHCLALRRPARPPHRRRRRNVSRVGASSSAPARSPGTAARATPRGGADPA